MVQNDRFEDASSDCDELAQLRESLSERYKAPLMSFFLRRIGDRTKAEDLAQEVLVRVIEYAKSRSIQIHDGFLFQIASNLLIDRARRAQTRRTNQPELEQITPQSEILTPERVVQGKQELAHVMRLLANLPPKTRNIFIQHRLEGLKYREIAEQYGLSISAVEKHMIKALSHLSRNVDR